MCSLVNLVYSDLIKDRIRDLKTKKEQHQCKTPPLEPNITLLSIKACSNSERSSHVLFMIRVLYVQYSILFGGAL